jgi:hypothetical protein
MACRCASANTGCSCVVTTADTPTIDMHSAGNGDAATPLVISGDAKRSAAAGNTLVINPDGLFVPASPLPAPGCGLRQAVPGGPYSAQTHPFSTLTREQCGDRDDNDDAGVPLDAACELNGAIVYCDSQGFLRTAPEKHTDVRGVTSNEGFPTPISITSQTPVVVGNTISMQIENPSDCYCMCGYLTFAFIEAMSATQGSFSFIYHEVDYGDGLGFIPTTAFTWDKRNSPGMEGRNDRPMASLPMCLDPGETKTVQYRVMARRFTGDAGGTVNITALAKDLRFVGSNV